MKGISSRVPSDRGGHVNVGYVQVGYHARLPARTHSVGLVSVLITSCDMSYSFDSRCHLPLWRVFLRVAAWASSAARTRPSPKIVYPLIVRAFSVRSSGRFLFFVKFGSLCEELSLSSFAFSRKAGIRNRDPVLISLAAFQRREAKRKLCCTESTHRSAGKGFTGVEKERATTCTFGKVAFERKRLVCGGGCRCFGGKGLRERSARSASPIHYSEQHVFCGVSGEAARVAPSVAIERCMTLDAN